MRQATYCKQAIKKYEYGYLWVHWSQTWTINPPSPICRYNNYMWIWVRITAFLTEKLLLTLAKAELPLAVISMFGITSDSHFTWCMHYICHNKCRKKMLVIIFKFMRVLCIIAFSVKQWFKEAKRNIWNASGAWVFYCDFIMLLL